MIESYRSRIYKNNETRCYAGKVVNSSDIAAHMCVACIGDEVTNALFKESSGTIGEDGVVGFIYEIAERIFVLRNHLFKSRKVACNNLEVIGDCH